MIDPSPNPSRQLRTMARVARWALGLVLAFWLLLAVAWGALHGFIVPRIGDWRVDVERLATQALGVPIHIEAMTAQPNGLFPTIHLSGVTVRGKEGREALKLNAVIATVSPKSLLRLGLEQLIIDSPRLDIRHLPDGRWQVAGVDMVQSDASETAALDWLLEQPELVIRKGIVHFTDEQRALGTVTLTDVDFVARHKLWSHVLSLDATPLTNPGERVQLIGAFRQPLLYSSRAPWTRWSGQWFAALDLQSIPQLPWPVAWGVESIEGHGAARTWLDIQNGKPIGMTMDLALARAHTTWRSPQTADLNLHEIQGRIEAVWDINAWHLDGQNFRFSLPDGAAWPSSNWTVSSVANESATPRIRLDLDHADLTLAAKVMHSIPVAEPLHKAVAQWMPIGQLREFELDWASAASYQARGKAMKLSIQPQTAAGGGVMPGFDGLNAAFEITENGGRASIDMQKGGLHFPGVFEEPTIAVDALEAVVEWHLKGEQLKIEVPRAKFSNADAQGRLHGYWQTGSQAADRLPGYLQLQGLLDRANGARVHRYLPLAVPEKARHYVRDSVLQGSASGVEFEVAGNLQNMPFDQPGTGRFFIKAPVKNVTYRFVPPSLGTALAPVWPALTDLTGHLVFQGASMRVQNAETGFLGHDELRLGAVNAEIPNLQHPHLTLSASGRTDLDAALGLVKDSPLAGFTSHALEDATAQGDANVSFALDLPIEHLERSKVRGTIGFQRNHLQWSREIPALDQLQGAVHFHEQGFELQNVGGQSLGGRFQIGGGMRSLAQGVRMQARGVATSSGMQKIAITPWLSQLAEHAQGQAAYTVDIAALDGAQSVVIQSDLRGMALDLPAPLTKLATEELPLSVSQTVSAQKIQDSSLKLAGRASAHLVRDVSNVETKVLRGQLVVGDVAALPMLDGITAQLQLPELDVDAWRRLLAVPGTDVDVPNQSERHLMDAMLPHRVVASVDRLRLEGRDIDAFNADFSQRAGVWRGHLASKQLAGSVEYRAPASVEESGRVFARLSHLSIPKSEAQKLNQATQSDVQSEVRILPALDVEVEQLEIAGRSLGKLQLKARNTLSSAGRHWMLDQFYLETPEARWKANGFWGATEEGLPRSTNLSFLLEMDSSGKLMERLGMPGVIHDGEGRLSGNIAWQGSPIAPDWRSMDGGVHMQVEKGQFLKVEPGFGKLLSVLSLQSLSRRITLDFRDVFSQGFAFDFIRGDVHVARGVARTNNLQMKGLNAAVLMEGQASLVDETQNLKVVVVPEINAMTASLAATAINPVIGLGSFLAQIFLRGPLMEAATRTFHVHGKWEDPLVEKISKKSASHFRFDPEEALP